MAGTGTTPGNFYGSYSTLNATPPQGVSQGDNGLVIRLQDSLATVCEKVEELLKDNEALWQEMTAIKMQIGDMEDSLGELRSRVVTIACESLMPSQKKRLPKALSVSASIMC